MPTAGIKEERDVVIRQLNEKVAKLQTARDAACTAWPLSTTKLLDVVESNLTRSFSDAADAWLRIEPPACRSQEIEDILKRLRRFELPVINGLASRAKETANQPNASDITSAFSRLDEAIGRAANPQEYRDGVLKDVLTHGADKVVPLALAYDISSDPRARPK